MNDRLIDAIHACLSNGRRLLDDAQTLEFSDPLATAYYLTLIAQEEFAKGFLLALVIRNVIPWDRRLLRAARDHRCKQLLCVVMDYLQPYEPPRVHWRLICLSPSSSTRECSR